MQKFWSVNSTLGQERHVYVSAEGSVIKVFYVKMFLRKFCSQGQSFMQNHQGVPELLKKNLQWEGGEGVYTPPPPPPKKKKKSRRVKIYHCFNKTYILQSVRFSGFLSLQALKIIFITLHIYFSFFSFL